MQIPGYITHERVYESKKTLVYKAIKKDGDIPVILKICRNEYPSHEEVLKFTHEYEILTEIKNDNIIRAYDLIQNNNSPVIVIENFGGTSLETYLRDNGLNLKEFLKLSIPIAKSIETIHQCNVIHKDINPSNIIFSKEKDLIKLIDFGISTKLSREITSVKNLEVLEGTLLYIAPEQTGRMNRAIDYRTDFYSLGVTFYRMVTEKFPFESQDPLELVHCHIAKPLIPPHEVNKNIPEVLSEIILKLMAKNAEDRYQSSYGLLYDLEKCQNELDDKGNINYFTPGELDVSDRFQIPGKLYGRKKETEVLISAFHQAAAGNTEFLLVSGFSGIGKSALINEIHKPIVKQRGNFISGKFEQYRKGAPYSAIIQAVSGIINQLLSLSDEKIVYWRRKLLQALGGNGKLII